jgi:zinc protease
VKKILFVAALLLVATLSHAQIKAEDIHTFTLDNGMKFIVQEDFTIPNVSFYIYWKVGSRNEHPGITGISHFFEHMMFNGSKNYGPGEFDRVMEANGGSNNAFTSENMTGYTNWVPSESLEMMFKLEADRIANLAFDDQVIESERGVVASERITGLENNNYRYLSEQVNAVALIASPYRWSVIGWESDIQNWSKQDLIDYHRTYYAPNNGVCIIVGAVKLDEVKALAKKYIEPIPAQEPPRPVHTSEPPQLGEKRIEVHKEVTMPNLMVVWHAPETKHPDAPALELLNTILSDGRTSRFYDSLVDEKQLALGVYSMLGQNFAPGLFTVYAVASSVKNLDELEAGIYEILDDIKINGVTERELQKAKNKFKMGFYSSMATNNGRATLLGTYELYYDDYNALFGALERYNEVTNEDIKRAANTYFVKRARTVGILKNLEYVKEQVAENE